MPCYDPRSDMSRNELREMERNEFEGKLTILKSEIDMLTQFLCEITKDLELDSIKDTAIRAWVRNHREWDKQRTSDENKNE